MQDENATPEQDTSKTHASNVGTAVVNYIKGGGSLDAVIAAIVGWLAFYGWPILERMGSDEMAMASLLGDLMPLVMTLLLLRIALFAFDKQVRISFQTVWAEAEPNARLNYLSARILGLCILFGMIVG